MKSAELGSETGRLGSKEGNQEGRSPVSITEAREKGRGFQWEGVASAAKQNVISKRNCMVLFLQRIGK